MIPGLAFFQWCEASTLGAAIKNSTWAFAVIESVHLLGLALTGGIVLIVNLRLLGLVLQEYSVADVARSVRSWFATSLLVMLSTGSALFLSEAVKCYYSQPFWIKMGALSAAIVFTVTVQRAVMSSESKKGPLLQKVVALFSLLLWFAVGAAGRWIGFSG